jgi:hypothetical protein
MIICLRQFQKRNGGLLIEAAIAAVHESVPDAVDGSSTGT